MVNQLDQFISATKKRLFQEKTALSRPGANKASIITVIDRLEESLKRVQIAKVSGPQAITKPIEPLSIQLLPKGMITSPKQGPEATPKVTMPPKMGALEQPTKKGLSNTQKALIVGGAGLILFG